MGRPEFSNPAIETITVIQQAVDDTKSSVNEVKTVVDNIQNTDVAALAADVTALKDTDLPAVNTNVSSIKTTDLPAVKTVIDDIHATDLPAVKTVIDDIHATDLPTVKTETASIKTTLLNVHDTDLPAVKTVIDDMHTTDLPAVKADTASVKTTLTNVHDVDLPAVKTVVDNIDAKISKLAEFGQNPTATTANVALTNTIANITGAGVLIGIQGPATTGYALQIDGGTVLPLKTQYEQFLSIEVRFDSSCILTSDKAAGGNNAAIYRLD